MREIKFRCWNGKKMTYLDIESVGDYCSEYDSNPEIMMWTGLLDKAGNEIYEGDVFKTVYSAGHSIHEVCFGSYDNEEEWEENVSGNGWYIKEHLHWPGYELHIKDIFGVGEMEIIGNIWENANLVKNK